MSTTRVSCQSVGVWAPGTGTVIELARLSGPHTGTIDTPPHLMPTPPARLTLNEPADRAQLYAACLQFGDPYDVYRYVNLHDLAAILPALPLPPTLAGLWAHALRDAGLPTPPPRPDPGLADALAPGPRTRARLHAAGGEHRDLPRPVPAGPAPW
jgi:hypothetical protein